MRKYDIWLYRIVFLIVWIVCGLMFGFDGHIGWLITGLLICIPIYIFWGKPSRDYLEQLKKSKKDTI